jgi:hypothetical protein
MATNLWMLVSSPDNFERARQAGFPVLAMKGRHLKKAQRVEPGDRIIFYTVGQMAFAGTFTVTSTFFESHEPIFESKKAGEDYPYRFTVEPNLILPPGGYLPAEPLLPQLEWVKKWPAEHWHLAFQGNVHVLSEPDFATIEQAIAQAATATPAGAR